MELLQADNVQIIWIVHLLATGIMAGLIWFVQVVHYPLFAHVPEEKFCEYEEQHQRLTGYVVIPTMLTELVTAALLLFSNSTTTLFHLSVVLLAINWLSTAFIQMPLHQRLGKAFSEKDISALVRSNWLRTVSWNARFIIVVAIVSGTFQS